MGIWGGLYFTLRLVKNLLVVIIFRLSSLIVLKLQERSTISIF